MKIIEAMKQVKDLMRKTEDLKEKVKMNCALLEIETPTYEDQAKQVSEWLQAHEDVCKEISRLRFAIAKTNVMTQVTIELGGKVVTKSIAEWITRRMYLAKAQETAWASLTDRGLRQIRVKESSGLEKDIAIKRFFDPKERDLKVELYASEPAIINGRLEVVNAVTDLIE